MGSVVGSSFWLRASAFNRAWVFRASDFSTGVFRASSFPPRASWVFVIALGRSGQHRGPSRHSTGRLHSRQKRYRVCTNRIIYRKDRQAILQSLRDQDSVKRVAMKGRQTSQIHQSVLVNWKGRSLMRLSLLGEEFCGWLRQG